LINWWLYFAPTIFFLILIPVLGLWGARRVRRDVFRLAGREEEEDEGQDEPE